MGVRFHASSRSCWARRCPSLSRERLGEANKHTYVELREAGASRIQSEMRAGMAHTRSRPTIAAARGEIGAHSALADEAPTP
jgi:hypothetical protein